MTTYKPAGIDRANRWMAKALDVVQEARLLAGSGQTRLGTYNRLYYAAHHVAAALLGLLGPTPRKHKTIISQFGLKWVKDRGFPHSYGKLLKTLYELRSKADYDEFVPTMERDVAKRLRQVELFIKRAQKEIPPVSTVQVLAMLVEENPEIRDFSFDFYCPKSYYHHTRLTLWCPKGRINTRWLNGVPARLAKTIRDMGVRESKEYVLGLNSRVNQYEDRHLLMLDFDNVSTVPYERFGDEPGFFFRTMSGFHFIGSRLYGFPEWKKRMKTFSRLASIQHFELSCQRGYATLRFTTSKRKPVRPTYIGRSREKKRARRPRL